MKKIVSVIIINWNNKGYIKHCMNSILNQTFKNLEIIFIDNESKDGSFEYFEKEFQDLNCIKIKNDKNLGYSGAANQGIRKASGEYVIILNPDILMKENFIENLYNFAEKDEKIAAISGKLLKYDFLNNKKLDIIDSAGIVMTKSRGFFDRGQNDKDIGQYEKVDRVFGVCGAAPFYRKKSLEDLKIEEEYFDEDFFAYKEDVDLSWRINLYGYKCMYLPNAVAYHGRGFDKSNEGIVSYVKNRNKKSVFIRKLSFRNNLLLQLKNETEETLKKDYLSIKKRNLKYLIYCMIFEPKVLGALKEVKELRDSMKKKNEIIKSNIKDIKNLYDVIEI